MKSLVVYDSQYGNTKTIAEEIAHVLEEHGDVTIVRAAEADSQIFGGEDLLAMGGPTQGHGPSPEMKRLLEAVRARKPEGAYPKALAFDTRLDWPRWLSGSAAGSIGHNVQNMGCIMLAQPESFIVKGSEGPLAEGEKERAAAWARSVMQRLQSEIATQG